MLAPDGDSGLVSTATRNFCQVSTKAEDEATSKGHSLKLSGSRSNVTSTFLGASPNAAHVVRRNMPVRRVGAERHIFRDTCHHESLPGATT